MPSLSPCLINLDVKNEQRNIIRILLLPAFYAVISFFSYRFYRAYTYFEVCLTIWESVAMVSFLYLLIQYVGGTPQDQRDFLEKKGKTGLPMVGDVIDIAQHKAYRGCSSSGYASEHPSHTLCTL